MSRRRLSAATIAVVAVGSALTVTATLLVRANAADQHDDALRRRADEAQLLLGAAFAEVRSTLNVLANVPLDEPGSADLFGRISDPLLSVSVRQIGVVEQDRGGFVVLAAAGPELVPGSPLSGPRAALAERAIAVDDLVSSVIRMGAETRLAFALKPPGSTRVVLRETTIAPGVPVPTIRGQAYGDLDLAVYASPRPDPASLVLSTAREVPRAGSLVRPLTVGADQWAIVAAPRGTLTGTFTSAAAWATLAAGAVTVALIAAVVETLGRRRRYAEEVVEARTAELKAALAEASRLELEARAATAAAVAANQSKSEFLSRMSHELRTPLNAVLGFAQMLELDDLTPEQSESVGQIRKGGRHLLDLINEILDIARIESGTFVLSPEAVLAGEVLGEAFDLMRPIAADQRITLVGDGTVSCNVHVFADRQRLKQILLNLLSNAVKYNRVSGSVAVACRTEERHLRLEVTDTGPGIPPEKVARLFQLFDRLDAEQSDVEGTGIGLALSQRLAEVMGGRLDVESELGQGSTFYLELPLVEGPVERYTRLESHIPIAAPDEGPRHTVVYIEDNLSNLRLVERLMERRGDTELVAAMQGRLGLDLARRHHPLVVLLDLHLPDLSGEQILRELRDDPITASVPVVILSADATAGQTQRLLAAGAYAFLTKPLDVRQLLGIIDRLIADAEAKSPRSVPGP